MDKDLRIQELAGELAAAKKRAAELSSLLRSFELINSTLNLHAVLDHLMVLAQEMTGSEAASALLLEDGRLCFVAATGQNSAELKKIYLEKGEGVAGWVVEHREPLLIADVTADPRFTGKVDAKSGFVTRSLLAVPLKIEERVIGVVEAVNKKNGRSFDESDGALLSSLATSAATAIHKAQLYADLDELFFATIKALANAIEAKDPYTRGHSERIRRYSLMTARELALPAGELKHLEIAALLHDVGKIGIAESILRKEGKLTDDEYREIQKHPALGAEMLLSIKQLGAAIGGIRHHQERYDGKGYPERRAGTDIPLFARVIAVADTFDAMTSDRTYRKALSAAEALAELERNAGTQFDPECVRAFTAAYRRDAGAGETDRRERARREEFGRHQGIQEG